MPRSLPESLLLALEIAAEDATTVENNRDYPGDESARGEFQRLAGYDLYDALREILEGLMALPQIPEIPEV
jgi:hypothetical protein